MLYRCRWCERAYCEDCLDWDKTTLIGNNLLEYEVLGYGEMPQAFYVVCHSCNDHFDEVPGDKRLCEGLADGFKLEHEQRFGVAGEMSTRAGSLTDATTIETPGTNTPIIIDDDDQIRPTRKRKLKLNHDIDRAAFKMQRFE
jgi:SWI/SNF-related matrix-associated actin-dependent regulator of chromatin subfamily A member 5